jgi:hypothetical protein
MKLPRAQNAAWGALVAARDIPGSKPAGAFLIKINYGEPQPRIPIGRTERLQDLHNWRRCRCCHLSS